MMRERITGIASTNSAWEGKANARKEVQAAKVVTGEGCKGRGRFFARS